MPAESLNLPDDAPASLGADAADALLVSGMRLVLAVAVLLASIIDTANFRSSSVWFLFGAYVLHSLLLYGLSVRQSPLALSKWIHWLDVVWYGVFVALTGGSRSLLFLCFFFAILSASFRWGFAEGARVTAVATALLMATAWLPGAAADWPRLLLRSSFLLTLGYFSAAWGESKVAMNRRLALLRDVSQLSNPRFGVDHTLTRVLEKTREFFHAHSCVLVLRDKETGGCNFRSVLQGRERQTVHAELMSQDAAAPLLAIAPGQVLLFRRSRRVGLRPPSLLAYSPQASRWQAADNVAAGSTLADLLESDSYLSAPVSLRRAEGRIFVAGAQRHASQSDAWFLQHIAAQAFPVIENIELVDRMASEAALQERRKIALDIHDRAVQPYIGLTLGLSAVRNKAEPGNPLLDDLDKLSAAARQAIEDLRRYAGSFKRQDNPHEPLFSVALQQQTAQIKALYGVEITVHAEPQLQVNDRLSAEVLQIVREGLSNICRHTLATRGTLTLKRSADQLHIQIDNDGTGQPVATFSPGSITERVASLGGRVQVLSGLEGGTSVQIQIPV